jgi:hypothetical protein
VGAPKPSRNAPCPCGSGKKIKNCCGEGARRWKPIDLGGFTVPAPPKGKVSLVISRESDLPQRLVAMARRAVAAATVHDTGDYEAVTALLLVHTAAEAVLNRLLEPLVSPDEWAGAKGGPSLERARTEKKWVRLSELLKMKPNLSRNREPLRSFLKTVEARNSLVHFKHGENWETYETPSVPWRWGETTQVPAGELARQPPKRMIETGQLHGALTREAVGRYFDSFRALLAQVMKHCPAEAAHVASEVTAALQDPVASRAEG